MVKAWGGDKDVVDSSVELFPFEYCHSRTLAKSSAGGKKRSSYSGSSSSGSSMSSQASSSATVSASAVSSFGHGVLGVPAALQLLQALQAGINGLIGGGRCFMSACLVGVVLPQFPKVYLRSVGCDAPGDDVVIGSSSLVEAVPTLGDSHCCCRRSSMNAGVGELVKLCVGACGDCVSAGCCCALPGLSRARLVPVVTNGERAPRDVGASRWATSSCDGSFSSGSSANWTLGSRVPGSSLAHTLCAGKVEV
eukprot:g24802.t1